MHDEEEEEEKKKNKEYSLSLFLSLLLYSNMLDLIRIRKFFKRSILAPPSTTNHQPTKIVKHCL
jgi:hypothetical protein